MSDEIKIAIRGIIIGALIVVNIFLITFNALKWGWI